MEKVSTPLEIVTSHYLKSNECHLQGKLLYKGNQRFKISDIKSFLDDEDLLDSLGIFRQVKSKEFDEKEFCVDVLDELKQHLSDVKREERKKLLPESIRNIDPSNFLVFKDIEADSDYRDQDKFIVHKDSYAMVTGMSISAYRHLIGEENYQAIKHEIPVVRKSFNPYLVNETLDDKKWTEHIKDLGCDVACINECVHPDWRYNRDTTLKLTMEEIYFIESSFVDAESLQYYIDAAYHTVIDKMWSYIMLYGVKGTGKTTLIEMLIQCVGSDNYRKAPQNALKKEFNGYKKNKRLVLMDEMVADTNAAINILKSDANKEFNVEEKSKETESVKNYVSMWIATNNISDWKFTYDERRFSVLELTKQTTTDREISDEWMSAFTLRIETEEFAQAFFNYLESKRSSNFNTMSPYKSEAFFQVVYESLKPWEMKIVDEIINGEKTDEIFIASLYEENDRFQPATHKKVIDFLDNYRHRGIKLGEYKRGKSVRNSSIIPSEKYRSPVKEQELK